MRLDVAELKCRLLDDERKDAERRLADPDYWGDTGNWVALAIARIEYAIDSVPAGADMRVKPWIAAVDAAIEKAHGNFRADEDDPDGYGSATFHQVRRRLEEMLEG